jgi:hypothetical protein
LDPLDRTFLAQTGRACRAAVAGSGLPRAGTRAEVLGKSVWVVTHRLREFVGSVERLAWAKESGCPWIAWICELRRSGRASGGDTVGSGAQLPMGHEDVRLAAYLGHLEVLKWARKHGCPWDFWTCFHAAAGGHLEVLQWAREHDCPWDYSICHTAALNGHLRCCSGRGSTGARESSGTGSIPGTTPRLTHGCWRNRRTTASSRTHMSPTRRRQIPVGGSRPTVAS